MEKEAEFVNHLSITEPDLMVDIDKFIISEYNIVRKRNMAKDKLAKTDADKVNEADSADGADSAEMVKNEVYLDRKVDFDGINANYQDTDEELLQEDDIDGDDDNIDVDDVNDVNDVNEHESELVDTFEDVANTYEVDYDVVSEPADTSTDTQATLTDLQATSTDSQATLTDLQKIMGKISSRIHCLHDNDISFYINTLVNFKNKYEYLKIKVSDTQLRSIEVSDEQLHNMKAICDIIKEDVDDMEMAESKHAFLIKEIYSKYVHDWSDLLCLMMLYLENVLPVSPYNFSSLDDETVMILPELQQINRLGLMTIESQPGLIQYSKVLNNQDVAEYYRDQDETPEYYGLYQKETIMGLIDIHRAQYLIKQLGFKYNLAVYSYRELKSLENTFVHGLAVTHQIFTNTNFILDEVENWDGKDTSAAGNTLDKVLQFNDIGIYSKTTSRISTIGNETANFFEKLLTSATINSDLFDWLTLNVCFITIIDPAFGKSNLCGDIVNILKQYQGENN